MRHCVVQSFLHHGDPPGHGTIGLSNGVTLTVLPEGGARAFSVVGTEGRLEIVNEARQAYHISFEAGSSSAPSLLPGIDPRFEDSEYDSSWVRGGELVKDLVDTVRVFVIAQDYTSTIRRLSVSVCPCTRARSLSTPCKAPSP